VLLINGAQACNVFWQVGGAATLGAASTFSGTILANAAITAGAGTAIDGRAFSVTAAVTLDANTVGGCDITAPTITAPADVVTTTGPGATLCSALVAEVLLTPSASDNSGTPPTLTRSPAGNTFAVGGTTVTHTASDLAGNTATATQLVFDHPDPVRLARRLRSLLLPPAAEESKPQARGAAATGPTTAAAAVTPGPTGDDALTAMFKDATADEMFAFIDAQFNQEKGGQTGDE
jgi:type VI secretion system secreted protein VgrG